MNSDLSAGNTLQAMNNWDLVSTQAFRMFCSSRRLQVVNNCGEKKIGFSRTTRVAHESDDRPREGSAENRPFPSSSQSLFQSEVKCEIFVMVISSNFNMHEN